MKIFLRLNVLLQELGHQIEIKKTKKRVRVRKSFLGWSFAITKSFLQ
jgi:hypothetical protein